ncbi:MAG: helix-turn-helix transcriptional regulator, partial [Gammaproteobacteria bacterium]|nr:helix-turn-helix transcriptional regulator [Gammaproteobacteria bacterium]
MADTENAYLTTRELAALLRIKERKVYDLAASGQIPCSRAMGKLLFPRKAIEAWIAGESINPDAVTPKSRPPVFLGSYEPLLEWALRESGCGLATLLDGSLDGLRRFVANEGVAAGLHVYDAADDSWNVRAVGEALRDAPVVLIEFAWRERGLIVAPGKARAFPDAAALRGHRVVPRQAGAGSQVLLEQLIAKSAVGRDEVDWAATARTESDAALAVLEGKAEAALGLRAMAEQLRLGFVPL